MGKPYPLEIAIEVKARAVEDREKELLRALVACRNERSLLLALSDQRDEQQRRISSLAEQTHRRLLAGESTAGDLALDAASQQWELEALARTEHKLVEVRSRLSELERLEQLERDAVARAQADLKAIERHRERFVAEQNRKADIVADEQAQEVFYSRRQLDRGRGPQDQ